MVMGDWNARVGSSVGRGHAVGWCDREAWSGENE